MERNTGYSIPPGLDQYPPYSAGPRHTKEVEYGLTSCSPIPLSHPPPWWPATPSLLSSKINFNSCTCLEPWARAAGCLEQKCDLAPSTQGLGEWGKAGQVDRRLLAGLALEPALPIKLLVTSQRR